MGIGSKRTEKMVPAKSEINMKNIVSTPKWATSRFYHCMSVKRRSKFSIIYEHKNYVFILVLVDLGLGFASK